MKNKLLNRDIMWGASTSAYQVEGAFNQDGKGLSVQDTRTVPEGTTDFKIASDHYNRMEEDLKLFKELGLQSYRFSISWSRIFPNGYGEVNKQGVDFYEKLINTLREYKIEPIATVFHFDLPYEIHKNGGWSNRETIDHFYNYCEFLFEKFGKKVNYWLTINEQNMLTLAGPSIYGDSKSMKDIYQENHHMLVAQAKVMKLYHDLDYPGVIGPAPNIAYSYANSSKSEDVLAAQRFSSFRNWLYLDAAVYGEYNTQALDVLKKINAEPEITQQDIKILQEGRADFIALNYYNNVTITSNIDDGVQKQEDQQSGSRYSGLFKSIKNPHLPVNEFGWEIDDLGFRISLHEVFARYRLPIMITENGLGAYDKLTNEKKVHDESRIQYLQKHIDQLIKAKEEGVNIISYNPWSAIDLVSTHQGFNKRYGFIYVNRDEYDLKDLKRYKKDSFYWYQNFIKTKNVFNTERGDKKTNK